MNQRYEYRVVWKRHGLHRKSKRYATRKGAERFALLLGPEPWKALDVDPDQQHCCSGHPECACEGATWREHLLAKRTAGGRYSEDDSGMPGIEYIRIEKRPVADWEAME